MEDERFKLIESRLAAIEVQVAELVKEMPRHQHQPWLFGGGAFMPGNTGVCDSTHGSSSPRSL